MNEEAFKKLKYDEQGLIPAVVQDFFTGEVLTVAYMNEESLGITLREGRTCFFSRSRRQLWRKGETSGNVQHVLRVLADCDYDALVVQVQKEGPACHLGTESCFHNTLFDSEAQPPFSVRALYGRILSRKAEMPEGSYTTYLFEKGMEKILKKVGEESAEVIIAAMKESREEVIYETADLAYHILVLLCEMGIPPAEILEELSKRHRIDHTEKQETTPR